MSEPFRAGGEPEDTGFHGYEGPTGPTTVERVRTRSTSSVLAMFLVIITTVAVIWFALAYTTGGGDSDVAPSGQGPLIEEDVPPRPECPVPEPGATGSGPLAGVELPCLGARHPGEIDLAATFAGTPTVLNVWAWNCAPCREELPILEEWAAANPDVRVVGVQAATSEGRGAAMLEELDVDFVSYHDGMDAVGPALELPRVVPVTVVLRADGTVAEILPRAFDSYDEFDEAIRGALA